MGAMCTEDRVSACTVGSECTVDCVIACMDVSADNTSMIRNMCPYISTKGTGTHRGTPTDFYMVKTVV